MAIKIIANYAKRLGLPGYSSHQFSVSVESELTELNQVQNEAARLYAALQEAVDAQIEQTGFVPDETYGLNRNGSGTRNNNNSNNAEPDSRITDLAHSSSSWGCSEKQKKLILSLVAQHKLDRNTVEELAVDRFGIGVRQLNKLQASGLISELLEQGSKGTSSSATATKNGNGGGPR